MKAKLCVLAIMAILLYELELHSGSVDLTTAGALRDVVLTMRRHEALTALLAGIALSISGLQMQTLFHNPLAGPYVLGLSSGATLGVALLILAGLSSPFGIAGAAMAGAAAVMLLLLLSNERVRDVMTLLVLGILFSSAISAVVQVLQFMSDEQSLRGFVLWTMGSLSETDAPRLAAFSTIVAVGIALACATMKSLNSLMLGEAYARSVGVDLRRSRFAILLSTTLLAGATTAFCGPIGFVGLAVPHLARAIFKTADHRILVPSSALVGAVLMLLCDLVSRKFLIPINAVTSLAGIPVVIYIILRK